MNGTATIIDPVKQITHVRLVEPTAVEHLCLVPHESDDRRFDARKIGVEDYTWHVVGTVVVVCPLNLDHKPMGFFTDALEAAVKLEEARQAQ